MKAIFILTLGKRYRNLLTHERKNAESTWEVFSQFQIWMILRESLTLYRA